MLLSLRPNQLPSAKQAATLADAEFEEDGRDWKVLKVQWGEEDECILVYYYDAGEVADDDDCDENDLDEDHSYVERSSMKEVLDWIKKSKK